MTGGEPTMNQALSQTTSNRVGAYAAGFLAVITVITFGFAIVAVPISGANCVEGCIQYPYLDTVGQFPKDFRWMIPAILLMLAYAVVMASIHVFAAPSKKIFSLVGLGFAWMSTLILVSDYFIQFSVVPISLMSGETEGIPLLIQYNAHGIFIVLEELGYLLMSLSFLFFAPVFTNQGRLGAAVRWIFIAGFVLAVLSLAIVSFKMGLDRRDRFEIIVISIDWLVLLINGILLSLLFKRQLKAKASAA